jgi:hypothetical protein
VCSRTTHRCFTNRVCRFKQEGLAEELVEFLGESMQCELVSHLGEAAHYRAAHRAVKRYGLQEQFPEVRGVALG